MIKWIFGLKPQKLTNIIFMNLMQIPVSALQLTILRIVYLNPGISKKEIIKKYNSNHIFEERVRRFKSSGIIDKNKICDNCEVKQGGGVNATHNSNVIIKNSIISNNENYTS